MKTNQNKLYPDGVRKIKQIGIDIKGSDQEAETGRFKLKTNLMNTSFIDEFDKISSQLINI